MDIDWSRLKVDGDKVVLTFFVGKDECSHYALNMDLDVGGAGDTLDEALSNAKDAVFAYLRYAVESGHWNELVPRKMPLVTRTMLRVKHPIEVSEKKLYEPKDRVLAFAH